MQAKCTPGQPLSSTAPHNLPRKIAPAKLAAKFRVKVAREKKRTPPDPEATGKTGPLQQLSTWKRWQRGPTQEEGRAIGTRPCNDRSNASAIHERRDKEQDFHNGDGLDKL